MNFFTILSVASSLSQAFVSYQQGLAMKAYYDSQADLARLKYEQEKVKAKEQGVQALKKANKTISTLVASAASSGILSTTGSVMLGQTMSLRAAAEDINTAQFNARILDNFGVIEYNNLKAAGEIQQQSGALSAISGLGTDLVSMTESGLFSPDPTPTPTPNYRSFIGQTRGPRG
jgi:hypothetical protein